jgi:hypothetical protein
MMPILFAFLALAGAATDAQVLPTRFEADRVFIAAPLRDGGVLTLYTDSGGGTFLDQRAVERLALPTTPGEDGMSLAELPPFAPARGIPPPLRNGGKIPVMPAAAAAKNPMDTGDGMLGEAWFGGRVWTWDYPGRRLVLEGTGWRPDAGATRVALGFRKGSDGTRETNFPRIAITVDGKPIDVLLDTGAMTRLAPAALQQLADGLPADRATSMIADSTFQAWKKAHPEWRVIAKAQSFSGADMIEVPEVGIAGAIVGPVWFTWRPDRNFREYMSGMMDATVEGAIGGNALRHFVMTVDYPGEAAYFRCVEDCRGLGTRDQGLGTRG